MEIVIAASECTPFVKTGGLADVVGSLPPIIAKEGIGVKVILPYYKKIKDKNIMTYVGFSFIQMGQKRAYIGLFKTKIGLVEYYFIDNEEYFNHDSLYGFGNDGERFAFFNFAILEAFRIGDFYPDLIHLNDWQTGLIPYLLKAKYHTDEKYRNIKTIFTIHNIQYQGNFPIDLKHILDVNYSSALEYHNQINFLKAAIIDANIITTVSPNYRNETLTKEYGYGLENILSLRQSDYVGILNGIDYTIFNPKTDKRIYSRYDTKTVIKNKEKNKQAFKKEIGLPPDEVMLCGLVSRLANQKGIELLEESLENIINYSDMQFILMGSGDKKYEDYFNYLTNKYPNRVKVYIGYNEEFAQKIYASVDCFFVPSLFEPCGLSQLIAMRYGTIPLVRETGGLKDTVRPLNIYTKDGNGFSFHNFKAQDFKDVLYIAYDIYRFDRENWQKIMIRNMEADFSWSSSALQYIALYEKLVQGGKQ